MVVDGELTDNVTGKVRMIEEGVVQEVEVITIVEVKDKKIKNQK